MIFYMILFLKSTFLALFFEFIAFPILFSVYPPP